MHSANAAGRHDANKALAYFTIMFAALLAFWAPPALANHTDGQGSACLNRDTRAEMLACYREDLASADADLNATYADIVKVLDADNKRLLVEAQRTWITFRDRFCAAEVATYRLHQNQAFIGPACLAALTRQQTESLKSAYWEKIAQSAARTPRIADRAGSASGSGDGAKGALLLKLIEESTPDSAVAVARVPGTDILVTYERGPGNCGSGGCQPQVWKVVGGRARHVDSLTVGFLPLVWFGTSTNGMPDLGLVTKEKSREGFVYPVMRFRHDGQAYVSGEDTLPEGSGMPLITEDDLIAVR